MQNQGRIKKVHKGEMEGLVNAINKLYKEYLARDCSDKIKYKGMPIYEIARKSNQNPNRVRYLVAMLVAENKIEKIGISKKATGKKHNRYIYKEVK